MTRTDVSRTVSNRLCLNVGSGLSDAPNWVSVDGSYSLHISRVPVLGRVIAETCGFPPWPKRTMWGDIVRGLQVRDCSCQLIFASHVLEHLSDHDFYKALGNLYSYLCPGGYLRCIVPDLETCAKEYIRRLAHRDPVEPSDANAYFLEKSNMGIKGPRSALRLRLREAFSNSRHLWMWDRPSLENALFKVGFRAVRFCKYGEWADDRFQEVEDEGRHVDSICAEAQKLL